MAAEFFEVEIGPHGEAVQGLAALLLDGFKRDEIGLRDRQVGEFASRARQEVVGTDDSIRHRPGGNRPAAVVLAGPEWSAGMRQQNFRMRRAIDNKTGV